MSKKKDANRYDKILRENIDELIIPFAEKLLNINPNQLEEITINLQITLERKPDFLKKVVYTDSKKDYILHIEFQTADEKEMNYRMNEYYGILLRKHKLDVHQYVFFIGEGKAKMERTIERKNLSFSFEVVNLQDFGYKLFLNSDKPEEIIIAILADFGKESSETVIKSIFQKLKNLPIDNSKKRKTVIQLEVLSNLRKLQTQIIEHIIDMPITYNIEEDIRYQQGQQAREKQIIMKLLKTGVSVEKIAEYIEVSKEFVMEIAKKLEK